MERDKEAEQKELEKALKKYQVPVGDMCPHCCTPVANFPFVDGVMTPGRVWLECPACGVVFVPKSVRDAKIAASTKAIVEAPKLVVPA